MEPIIHTTIYFRPRPRPPALTRFFHKCKALYKSTKKALGIRDEKAERDAMNLKLFRAQLYRERALFEARLKSGYFDEEFAYKPKM